MVTSVLEILLLISISQYEDKWWSEDKAKHFAVSFIMATGTYVLAKGSEENRKEAAVSITFSIGLLKEIYDWRVKNHFSFKDLFFDFIGILAAVPP